MLQIIFNDQDVTWKQDFDQQSILNIFDINLFLLFFIQLLIVINNK